MQFSWWYLCFHPCDMVFMDAFRVFGECVDMISSGIRKNVKKLRIHIEYQLWFCFITVFDFGYSYINLPLLSLL